MRLLLSFDMATKSPGDAAGAQRGPKQTSMFMTIVVVLLGVWIGLATAGGGLYWLVKSGRIPSAMASSDKAAGAVGTAHSVALEPILVNLADEGGHAYLRLGLTVDVEEVTTADKPAAEGESKEKGAAKVLSEPERWMRDTVLTVLGRQTSAYLLGPDGKEHLKIELKEEIERGQTHMKVKELYFTDFLVQI